MILLLPSSILGFEKDKVFQRTAIKIKNSDSNIK